MAGWRRLLGILVALVGIVTAVLIAMAVQGVGLVSSPGARAQAYLAAAQAAASLLLVVLTAVYAHSTHAMAEEMRVQREWAEARARQAQARRVWARLTAVERDGEYMEATIHNASDEPISHAVLILLDWPWRSERRAISTRVYERITPGDVGEPSTVGPLGPVPNGAESSRPPIEIVFTDADGYRWRREPDGRLVLHEEDQTSSG